MIYIPQNPSGRLKEAEAKRQRSLLHARIADLGVEAELHRRLVQDDYPNRELEYLLATKRTAPRSPLLSVDPPSNLFPPVSPEATLHPLQDLVSSTVINDLQLLVGDVKDWTDEPRPEDHEAFQSEFVRTSLREWGYDPDTVLNLPNGKKFRLAKKMTHKLHQLVAARNETRDELDTLKDWAADQERDIEEVSRLLQLPFKLERPQGTSMHHLSHYMHHQMRSEQAKSAAADIDAGTWQSFVVEHDWAAAFKGAGDFDQGDFPLPYDRTAFEFRVNGMRVIMMCGPGDEGVVGNMTIGINGRWYLNADRFSMVNGHIISVKLNEVIEPWAGHAGTFLNRLAEQIRAICIVLDAGVARRERIRPSQRLNEQRVARGKTPLRDYHVVSLARRPRTMQAEDHVVTPGTRKRLHFRRGHYRHFDTPGGAIRYANQDGITVSKTWINWNLIGNPDLGFVDKHYKL